MKSSTLISFSLDSIIRRKYKFILADEPTGALDNNKNRFYNKNIKYLLTMGFIYVKVLKYVEEAEYPLSP